MSNSSTPRPLRRSLSTIAILVALSALVAPVAVYVFGVSLIAPYDGDGGMLGFLGNVYGDALHGRAAAWGLLLSPAALVLTWWAAFRLLRAGRRRPETAD